MVEPKELALQHERLWKLWKEQGDIQSKKQLIEYYLPLIDYVVHRLSIGLPHNISKEDLASYGIMGLIDAVEKFDLSRGLQFETYASWRIRGAIIDGLRQSDWVPRSIREKSKKIEEAYQVLEQTYLRSVSDQEMCDYLKMSEQEFHQMLQDVSMTTLFSLDDPIKDQDQESRLSLLEDERVENPEQQVNVFYIKDSLAKAIERLTEKERTVVSLFYYEELSLSEIASVMNLSPSRISQLHSKAILKLKGALSSHRDQLLFDR